VNFENPKMVADGQFERKWHFRLKRQLKQVKINFEHPK
jgi:hypothetical protein